MKNIPSPGFFKFPSAIQKIHILLSHLCFIAIIYLYIANTPNKRKENINRHVLPQCLWFIRNYLCRVFSPISFATLWTAACQTPLSMEFSRQEYWSGFSFSSPRHLPGSGIEPVSPKLACRFFTTKPTGKPPKIYMHSFT